MIGIYGGTFDPIHWGHIALAVAMREIHQLEEVWFCPVWISPHKNQHPTPAEERLAMLQLALEEIPHCYITDVEIKRPGPSYTINTLRTLKEEQQLLPEPKQFCFILGDDAVQSFCQWHQPEEIIKEVPIFIGRRTLIEPDLAQLIKDPLILKALQKGLTQTPLMEISATDIRCRLREGKYCGHLLPLKVIDYIKKHRVY